jgi:hypothetical protein
MPVVDDCSASSSFEERPSSLPDAGNGLFASDSLKRGTTLHFGFADEGAYRIRLATPESQSGGGDHPSIDATFRYLDDRCLANKANEAPELSALNAHIIITASTAALQLTKDVAPGQEILTDYGSLFGRQWAQKERNAAAKATAATASTTNRINGALLIALVIFIIIRSVQKRRREHAE